MTPVLQSQTLELFCIAFWHWDSDELVLGLKGWTRTFALITHIHTYRSEIISNSESLIHHLLWPWNNRLHHRLSDLFVRAGDNLCIGRWLTVILSDLPNLSKLKLVKKIDTLAFLDCFFAGAAAWPEFLQLIRPLHRFITEAGARNQAFSGSQHYSLCRECPAVYTSPETVYINCVSSIVWIMLQNEVGTVAQSMRLFFGAW